MNSAEVFAQIEKMGELPSLPQHLLQIQQVATDSKSNADDLAQCILQDQALTMRVLRVVNSAKCQRRNQEETRTVRRALPDFWPRPPGASCLKRPLSPR